MKYKYVLVCNCLECECPKIYNNLNNALEGGLQRGNFKIYNIKEYDGFTISKQDDIWKELRFVCFNAKSGIAVLIAKAINDGIPVILVRDKGYKPCRDLYQTLKRILYEGDQIESTENIQRMIYEINEPGEIIGAIRWVNDYYHPLTKKAILRITQEVSDGYMRAK